MQHHTNTKPIIRYLAQSVQPIMFVRSQKNCEGIVQSSKVVIVPVW